MTRGAVTHGFVHGGPGHDSPAGARFVTGPAGPRLSLIYDDLRVIAHRELDGGGRGQTLSTTALVDETYLRLADDTRVTARGRAYSFAAGTD